MIDKVDAKTLEDALAVFQDILSRLRRNIELDLRVAAPAQIVTYDVTQGRATVQLDLIPVKYEGEDEVPEDPITIPGIPVRWPGASSGYMRTNLVPGDTGHVVFFDRCLSPWLLKGGPVDPINGRTHALADAVFEPGMRHGANPIVPVSQSAMVLHHNSAIHLGEGATHQVALAQLLHTYLVTIITAAATGTMDGGALFKTNLLAQLAANPFSQFAATKTRAS